MIKKFGNFQSWQLWLKSPWYQIILWMWLLMGYENLLKFAWHSMKNHKCHHATCILVLYICLALETDRLFNLIILVCYAGTRYSIKKSDEKLSREINQFYYKYYLPKTINHSWEKWKTLMLGGHTKKILACFQSKTASM